MTNKAIKSTAAKTVLSDPRWSIVVGRKSDGRFFYSVATTGVYCRPDCASRLPGPENVQFFDSCQAAEAAGFRPCKRCRPNGEPRRIALARKMETACRLIEKSDETLTLTDLASRVHMGRFHFHRTFKAMIGVTPKGYAAAIRDQKVRAFLNEGTTVTEAIFNAGYGSSSRFYERSRDVLGMKSNHFRAGGAEEIICYTAADCELGKVLVAESDVGVCSILLGDDEDTLIEQLAVQFPAAVCTPAGSRSGQLIKAVVEHIKEPSGDLDIALDIRGTAFQQRVWNALREIPAGTTSSYGEIANRIGQPQSARAVANACASNSLALAIPCHRVVRRDGKISGYRWGQQRKRRLLDNERK